MYVPRFNAVSDETEIRAMVSAARTGWLVTVADDGTPEATLMPIIWEGDTVIAHLAKANPQWRHIAPDAPALLIVPGPQAYISPSWYPAKTEHGKVVPTWNYTAVHLHGTVRLHHDPDWLYQAVSRLTDMHEQPRPAPWHVTDAPDDYIAAQLRSIIGIEFDVRHVDAKAKLSQNRSEADQRGVVRGLLDEPDPAAGAIVTAMASAITSDAPSRDLDATTRHSTDR